MPRSGSKVKDKSTFNWPARWFPLRPHPEVYRCWHHPARFKTIHAGRRSYKSETRKRKAILWTIDVARQMMTNQIQWNDPRIFIAAPTRQQVKDIYWLDIKALMPPEFVSNVSETELRIVTKWNASIELMGLDKPQRGEGRGWDGGIVDEIADCKPAIFDAHLRPMLSDRKGWCDLTGVPDMSGPGQYDYREMCQRGQDGNDPEWADFAWGSKGILPDTEIESMQRSMDPRLFEQETTGAFIVAGGRAFPDFSRDRHVAPVRYDPDLPLRVMLDFNVDPMSVVIGQHTKDGQVRVLRVMQLPDTVSRMAAIAFVNEANRRSWKLDQVFVYGDPAGKQRSTAADTIDQTSWTMFYDELTRNSVRFTRMVKAASVPIPATVNSVNRLLMNAAGVSCLTINNASDSGCSVLIKAMEAALAQTDMDEFHALAAFRYYAEREFPVHATAKNAPIHAAIG